MRRTKRSNIEDLRLTIDCLPVHTRVAMLQGINTNEIIVGAYSDRKGGVCPMLAAHRCGGRTNFISFARAWDRFAHAKRARRATEREITVLRAQLEGSLMDDESVDLEAALRDHQALARERRAREAQGTLEDFLYESPGSPPPGPTNWISGTTQPDEVLSR